MLTVAFVLFLAAGQAIAGSVHNDMGWVYDRVLSGYNKDILPQTDPGVPVNVSLDFTLVQLEDVDQNKGELELVAWIGERWNDPRLSWNPEDFHGIKSLALNPMDIWTPDINAFNSVQAPRDNLMGVRVKVSSNGNVVYYNSGRIRVTCPINDLNNFTCKIFTGSWVFDNSQLDVFPAAEHFEMSKMYTNTGFSATFMEATRMEEKYDCCEEFYTRIIFAFNFQKTE